MIEETKNHEFYMKKAIELAKRGEGKVIPNPLVGAILVERNRIIGEGFHEKYGGLHAERNAFLHCNTLGNSHKITENTTLYVTLEPCCHTGKTPPCTDIILEKGIKKVVVGCLDPHHKVSGKGIKILKKAGVYVVISVLETECKALNTVFFHYITKKIPFVVMKYAMTLDGKIATISGESQWITSESAREQVQHDRNKYTAIMVGLGTVIADNPRLSCRIPKGRNPIRIICDTHLKTPLDCHLVKTAKEVRTIIATCESDVEKQKDFYALGCEIILTESVEKEKKKVNLNQLMSVLGSLNIDSILLEGGSNLHFSALEAGIVQKVQCYIAPKLFGGNTAKTPVGGSGFSKIEEAIPLKKTKISQIGFDFLLEGEVDIECLQES